MMDTVQETSRISPRHGYIACLMDINASDLALVVGTDVKPLIQAIERRASAVNADTRVPSDAQDRYDVVVLVDILRQTASPADASTRDACVLDKVKTLLKPEGRVYIALNNRLGMQYFAGYKRKEEEQAYRGVEGSQSNNGQIAKLYSKYEIESVLHATGFEKLYFYYPYPDYELPSMVFSDDRLLTEDDPIEGKLYTAGEPLAFDVARALKSLANAEEQKLFAPSFLIEARLA